jgi:hypothetical protein
MGEKLKKQDPTCKITEQKKRGAGGMVQVVEHLASKHEVLSSNPSTTQKKEDHGEGGRGEEEEG